MAEPRPETLSSGVTALPPGYRLADFEILRTLGRGGFAIVYLAYDQLSGERLAIKEFAPHSTARRNAEGLLSPREEALAARFHEGLSAFTREARIFAGLYHPTLPRIMRLWQQNGSAYYAMPYYPGLTLQQLAGRAERLSPQWLDKHLGTLLGGLEQLHRNGHHHHDIAPDNIILDSNDSPVLLDLGAAIGVPSTVASDTRLIKPSYSPLEQYCRHEHDYGAWSDLYALAAVLYHLIVGHPPPTALARSVQDTLVPLRKRAPTGYPPHALAAIDRALRLPCHERPQTVAEFALELGLHRQGQDYRPSPSTNARSY